MGWVEVPENQNPFYTKTASLKGMNPDFMGAFAQMAQDYYQQTGKAIKVDDAFRSHAAQADAYRRKPNLAAPPGHSLHEQGLAMDIDTGEANDLAQRGLLQKYGFNRPMLGQGRSGKNEPWHIQYAGMRRQRQAQQPTGGKWVEVPEEEPGIWGSAKEAFKQSVGELAGTYGSLLGQRPGESREDAYKRIAGATAQGLGATGQQPPDTWRGTVGSVLGSLPVPLAELGAMNALLPGGGGIAGSMLRGGATFGAQQGLRPGGSVPRGVAEGLAFGAIPPGAGRLARGAMGGAIGVGSTYMQPGEKSTKDYAVGSLVPGILAMMGGKKRTPESPAPEPVPEVTPELAGRNPFLALPGGVTPQLRLTGPSGEGFNMYDSMGRRPAWNRELPEGGAQRLLTEPTQDFTMPYTPDWIMQRNLRTPLSTGLPGAKEPLALPPGQGFVLRESPPETKLRKTPWRGGYQAVEEKIDAGLRVPPERTTPTEPESPPTAKIGEGGRAHRIQNMKNLFPGISENQARVLADYPALYRDVSRKLITPEEAEMRASGEIKQVGGLRKYGELPKGKQLERLGLRMPPERSTLPTQPETLPTSPEIIPKPEKVIPATPEPPTPAAKEPWEMTRGEYLKNRIDTRDLKAAGAKNIEDAIDRQKKWGNKSSPPDDVALLNSYVQGHETRIKQALAQGKPVPPSVLADYPDLQPKEPGAGKGEVTYSDRRMAYNQEVFNKAQDFLKTNELWIGSQEKAIQITEPSAIRISNGEPQFYAGRKGGKYGGAESWLPIPQNALDNWATKMGMSDFYKQEQAREVTKASRKPVTYDLTKAEERGDYRTFIRAYGPLNSESPELRNFAREEKRQMVGMLKKGGRGLDDAFQSFKQDYPHLASQFADEVEWLKAAITKKPLDIDNIIKDHDYYESEAKERARLEGLSDKDLARVEGYLAQEITAQRSLTKPPPLSKEAVKVKKQFPDISDAQAEVLAKDQNLRQRFAKGDWDAIDQVSRQAKTSDAGAQTELPGLPPPKGKLFYGGGPSTEDIKAGVKKVKEKGEEALNFVRRLIDIKPDKDNIYSAIKNTPGADFTPQGLRLTVARHQQPEQAGERALRTGVFYLPEEKSPYRKHYTTGKMGYGGPERYEGTTTYQRPIFVKAGTGGHGPEIAYDRIEGKGAYQKMRSDVLEKAVRFFGRNAKQEDIEEILKKYGGNPNLAYDILHNSRQGNQLAYAIQEHIVASRIRAENYDSVISYSKHKGEPRLSEVFDVREEQYPWKNKWQSDYEDYYRERPTPEKLYGGGPSAEDIKAGVKKVKEWWGEREPLTMGGHTWDGIKYSIGKYFGATKTPEGTKAKRDVTRMAGRWQTDKLQAEALFGDAESRYGNLDRQGFAKLVSPIQRGGKSPDPAFQKLYDLYHEMGDSLWQKINQYKPLAYLDHYFRQSWTNADDPAIRENINNYFNGRPFINYLDLDSQGTPKMESRPYGGKSMTGGRSYFKQRVIPDVETGMMLGLQPREMNPVRHMLNDLAEKSHFVRGMELWDSYFKSKTIKYFRPGSQPAGWQAINDPMARVSIPYLQEILEKRSFADVPGEYDMTAKPDVRARVLQYQAYAPEEVARTFNNWLSVGFRGEPWYDAYRGIVDPLRKIGVSLSTFHLKMTLNTDMAMRGGQHMSKAIGYLLTGDPINAAKEAKMLGRTWSGEQFIRGQYLGKGLLSELLSPGTHPELREVAMDMRDSGLLPNSAKSLQPWIQASRGALKEAAQEGYGTLKNLASGKPLKAVQSAWRGFDRFLDATAAPIMEYGVPRAKAAAFAFLRKAWLEEAGKKYGGVENIPPEVKAQGMYDTARHVDHMMGQVNYDALHFNRKLRDLLFFAIKYPGWNIGSAAWMTTGARGIAKTLTGRDRTTLDKTAMRTTLGLLASVGVTGLVTQYLLTGSFPDNPADIYTKGIKTGFKDDYGNDEYVRDATYLKDLQSVLHDPVRTFQSKSPDVLRVMGEIYNNSDYFGTDIWTPGAPITQKAKELGGYGFTNLALPYSMRNVAASQSPFAKFGSFGGYSPTPRWLKESPLETTLSDANKRRTFKQTRQQFESRQLEKELVKKYRESKDPVALQQGLAEAQQAGKLTAKQAQQTFKNAPVPPDIMRFWKSPVDVALTAFERGTPEEKRKYGRLLEEKLNRAVKGRPEWIQENKERIRNVLREIPQ